MKMQRRLLSLACLFLIALIAGSCSIKSESETVNPVDISLSEVVLPPTTPDSPVPAAPTNPGTPSGEQALWDSVEWYTGRGPACTGAQLIPGINLRARIEGEFVYFEWDADINSIWDYSSAGEYILVQFLRKNPDTGIWYGGKFDWIRPGGQGLKGLVNIINGYQGLKPACCGETVAFAWTNDYGTERSNLAYCEWP